ncbi:neprilysin-2-like [Brevipalpus obovatus]|uniref:neprilysin-2-like n=1 Tax=Brevipalpus obovatus TaxID=246614 RepID=UPI003D9E48E4
MIEKSEQGPNNFRQLYKIDNVGPSEIAKPQNWWSSRTRLERWLLFLLILFILSAVMTISILVYFEGTTFDNILHNKSSQKSICTTPGCVKAAARILEILDQKTSPCQDFYQFACGNWIKKKHINEDQSGITQFGALRDELNRKLRALVEAPANSSEAVYYKMMRTVYKQCMDIAQVNEQSKGEIVKDIVHLGGWPLIEGPTWKQNEFDWIESLKRMKELGYSHNIFLTISVTADIRNNSRNIIDLDQVIFAGPNRKYLMKGLNDTVVKAYYQAMVDSASYIGKNSKEAIEEGAKEILDFEVELAKIALPFEKRRNFTELYHKMKLGDIVKFAPKVPWADIVRMVINQNLTDDEEINVKVPRYLTQLDEIMATANTKTIANYMVWRMVFSALPISEEKLRRISEEYERALFGKKGESPRWDTCINHVYATFKAPLSALYVRSSFDEESRSTARKMVKYIRDQFIASLKKVDWMDPETRNRAIEKAKEMEVLIGYPPELLQEDKIMEMFEGLEVRDDVKYYRNSLAIRKHQTDYSLRELRKPIVRNDWRKFIESATVNAFNNFVQNMIKFPAGILQGVFFDKDRPDYLNFGGIGYIIGHEITHGFDDKGRQFDKEGNNVKWWLPETETRFRDKVQCIIEQYGNYSVDEIGEKLNGLNTQGENIADNGGLKQAYLAYQKFVLDTKPEPILPGLTLNQEQLFWVSAANIWCSKLRPETLRLRVLSGAHSPAKFRVNGPLSNMKEFAKSFKCPKGSPMNPVKKCSVW